MASEPPILPATLRNLSDKLYDKRKLGALECEKLVKELKQAKDTERISAVITQITKDFIESSQANSKKGGLIALAATAIGLGTDTGNFIGILIPPVLKCFTDADSKVRYYACESLYNIAKVARTKALVFFNEVFDGLCKLSADPDPNVKNGAQLLDRLVKDILTEAPTFDMEHFIPLLQERIYVTNAFCREFLISWISVLDSVPGIDMVGALPKYLDGIFNMLKDGEKGIQQEANSLLGEFLHSIKVKVTAGSADAMGVDLGSMVPLLIDHCESADDFTRLTALNWLHEFIVIGKEILLPYSASMLGAVLPCISHNVESIEEAALRANTSLLALINDSPAFQIGFIADFLNTLTLQFLNIWVPTRLAALRWVLLLHTKVPDDFSTFLDELFPVLLKTLSDPSDEVVRLDLEVMAKISQNDVYFLKLMHSLIKLFGSDPALLENRGSLIIRQLCLFISAEKIYRTLAKLLENEEDLEFAGIMIQTLSLILLTATELHEVRAMLKDLSCSQSRELFVVLYRSWAHNAASVFALCLLAQVYEHASQLVTTKFAELEITVNFLMQIDKLVQLLESPIFVYLRLQLLEPEKHCYLYKCLFGVLMLLPQSSAFELLRSRLNCGSSLNVLQLIPKGKENPERKAESGVALIDFDELLLLFGRVQDKHRSFSRQQAKFGSNELSPRLEPLATPPTALTSSR